MFHIPSADAIGSIFTLTPASNPKYLNNPGKNEADASIPPPKVNNPELDPSGIEPYGLVLTVRMLSFWAYTVGMILRMITNSNSTRFILFLHYLGDFRTTEFECYKRGGDRLLDK